MALDVLRERHRVKGSYCFDTSLAAVGANNAIFITLKPGVAYQVGVGSFADSER